MRYRDFPLGVVNNPLVKNIFAEDVSNIVPTPPVDNHILTESGLDILTESSQPLLTET